MDIQTASSNKTLVIEDGKEIFPCRCGQIHMGPYAANDFAHCNCLHNSGLVFAWGPDDSPDRSTWELMCMNCGKTFDLLRRQ